MNRWHALAAILALMTVRGASHRIAALHGELGCGHTHAIERIARESRGEYRDKHPACKAHDNQSRGATGRVSRSRTARDGCERDETGASKTIRTPASPYHRKEESPSPGRGSALEPCSRSCVAKSKRCLRVAGATSPQCQPIADSKQNNLDRIEHPLDNCFTRFTGRNCRLLRGAMTLTAQSGLRRLTVEDPPQLFAQGVGH